ncbi:redoxin domain-containing protein [Paenibacillus profundus]|uniref:Redoxin domain-containing protein n=1 Tax=Paenibacillus profundus TaxID=1173085 RepID=A0ABS8YFG7_9BACL|nr:redoxin domain-containing protein [Paenibacillus profundus]MCE5169812.1 redoxin domain-containing protein [Paenibacillus profundus]
MSVFVQLSIAVLWVLIIALLYFVTYIFRKSYEAVSINQAVANAPQHSSLEIGDVFPRLEMPSTSNEIIHLKQPAYEGTILLVSVYGCDGCEELYPNINQIAKTFSAYQVITIIIAPIEEVVKKQNKYKLETPIHQLDLHEMRLYGTSTFPFAYILSPDGIVMNKGTINGEERIRTLIHNDEEKFGQLNMDVRPQTSDQHSLSL